MARESVRELRTPGRLPPRPPARRQVFETIIRVVGGFLAAHELTGDEVLVRK